MPGPHRWRLRAGAALLLALLGLTWLRAPIPPPRHDQTLRLTPLRLPPSRELAVHLGVFRLDGVWQLNSPNADFGSYSAMVALGDGQLLAFSDRGYMLRFTPPGTPGEAVAIGGIYRTADMTKANRDAEAAARDPASGRIWIAWENRNALSRFDAALSPLGRVRPPAMRDWPGNSGPEAMVRLADGRFVVTCECSTGWFEARRHPALLFDRDPLAGGRGRRLTFEGPENFSVTDMAQLPDGRVLVLMRRVVWPFPARFAGRLALADPAGLKPGAVWRGREVAKLTSSLPVDNFEAMAIQPGQEGRVIVWLMSDDNGAYSQRALLWKLSVDPAKLLSPQGQAIRPRPSSPARASP